MFIYRNSNSNNSIIMALMLTIPVFLDVLNVVVQQFHLGSASIYTVIVHFSVLLYLFTHVKVDRKDVFILATIYIVFVINYIIFPVSREYIISKNMFVIYFSALPCAVISVRKIDNWEGFLKIYKPYPVIGTIIGALMIVFLDYSKYLVYMDFSYAMLPSVCANYYYARTKNKSNKIINSYIHFFSYIISLVEIIVFGARAPIFFSIMYVIVFELARSDKKKIYKVIISCLFASIIVIFVKFEEEILNFLSSLKVFRESRFFMKFLSGKLLYSKGRDELEILCNNRIKTMGFEISGFFGDRSYCGSEPYPHSIIREVLMSWGWIIGIVLLSIFFGLFIKVLNRKNTNRDIFVFLIFSVFARFFVSGSYVQESKFYIFLFAVFALRQNIISTLDVIVDGKEML